MIVNKITVWKKKTLFKKEEYYFTYGYSNNDNLSEELDKVRIMFS
jgi:hypothetical protein